MAYFRCGTGGTELKIVITTESTVLYGQTITISKGGSTVGTTTFDNQGEAEFDVDEPGTYTVSVTYDGRTFTDTVEVTDEFESVIYATPDGSTVTPVNDIQIWLHCGNVLDKAYTTLDEVLADSTTLNALINSQNAVDYMVRSTAWAANLGLVPIMTSNTTPYGEVVSSAIQSGSYAYYAFNDGDTVATTVNTAGASAGEYIGYHYINPITAKKAHVIIDAYWGYSATVCLQGSNDGTNWSDITEDVSISSPAYPNQISNELWFTITDDNYYQYHRIIRKTNTKVGGDFDYFYVRRFQFYVYDHAITEDSTAMTMIGANNYCADTLLADSTWLEAICNSTYFESVLNTKVPTMISNTTPSGESSASSSIDLSDPNALAYKGFDGNASTNWHSARGHSTVINDWLAYEFASPVCIKAVEINQGGFGYNMALKVQAYIEGQWVDITGSLSVPGSVTSKYAIHDNNNIVTKYRVSMLTSTYVSGGAYYSVICELQFYGRTDV